MNHKEFIRNLAKESGYGIEDALIFYNIFIKEVRDGLKRDKEVNILKFGKFYLSEYKGSKMGFKKDGSECKKHYRIKFKPSVHLKKVAKEKEV